MVRTVYSTKRVRTISFNTTVKDSKKIRVSTCSF
jgi:hypothetical protein